MATSGSKDFIVTLSEIVESSLRKAGAYDQGEAVPGDEFSAAKMALNVMLKAWTVHDLDIWLRSDVTVFLQPGTKQYLLGTAEAAYAYETGALTSAGVWGSSSVNVTFSGRYMGGALATPVAVNDRIGIRRDDGLFYWTTISSVTLTTELIPTDGGDWVQAFDLGLTVDLPASAGIGNTVYTYTTKAARPQRILYAFRSDTSGQDTEITIVGENDYQRQSNKGSAGPPVEVWYRQSLGTGTLHVWPVDGGSTFDKIVLVAQYQTDDLDAPTDNPQFPAEWYEAIIYGLADRLAPEYGLTIKEKLLLKQEAKEKLDDALDYDVENASVIFALDVRG